MNLEWLNLSQLPRPLLEESKAEMERELEKDIQDQIRISSLRYMVRKIVEKLLTNN